MESIIDYYANPTSGSWAEIGYEHASEERDALLAQALNPYTNGGNVVSIGSSSNPIAQVACTTTLRWKVRSWTYPR